MKEITVTEPHFVTTFSCSGSACRDHCCKGWKISLDKATVKKYVSSQNETIRKIARKNIILLKKGVNQWGEISLPSALGNCPYLDEERLCMVHKTLGPKALSQTCSLFPRRFHTYKHEVRHSLSLSCPEVAARVLNDPDAMVINDKTVIQPKLNTAPVFQPGQKLLNLFCLSIINHAEVRPEAALYALIKFMMVAQKFFAIDDHALAELEQVYVTLIAQLQSGETARELEGVQSDNSVKVSLVLQMQDYFLSLAPSRGSNVLDYYIQCLLRLLTAEEGADIGQRISEAETALDKRLREDEQHGAYALRNFILYKIWENNFPNQPEVEPLRALYIIVAEYAFIKLLIAASASERGRLEWEDVTNIVYSFHSRSQHNRDVAKHFHQHIETARTGDDLSMIHLLA
ncbi:flagellin lysine-N-methylase [Citrobacter rodentium]|uniref:Flagellin lysine-N-methylase n=2 Tax=Citrobacter rodentium TaxID=67825 RepID=D2TNN5_CITRI|nr:flagellin lysine-N-methylase [Citrobacter rodentium]KIQ51757.1 lysine-N-methylase [Citrobacter rodentium]QBY28516.1 lysine-N-methylase [Citrobacter rodentium]UHO29612.1 flagellin lysine-N-methylase [Citrobacter rodentium NBRC 105723 = DSM 16636]CBG88729.1 flagellin lysine-N-methylase [Citrobacter rodentium ICC168]HAT8015622.1 lysine-N-methylase [Citrobacter rodentium NBRC 105723 = DSM 16636]